MAAENHGFAPKYRPEPNVGGVMDVEAMTGRYRRFDCYEVVDPWDNDSRLLATVIGGAVTVA